MRIAFLIFTTGCFAVTAAIAEEGVWTTENTFAQFNVFCTRVYTCVPASDILHGSDTKVIVTSPKSVRGVCSAGDGPVDSCNDCLTNPPEEKCEWHLAPN
jgi:hypothetical protein